MTTPTIRVLGRRIRALERIGTAAEIAGWSRSTAYRMADSGQLPLTGPPSSRFVCMIPWLDSLGIPFALEGRDVTEDSDADA